MARKRVVEVEVESGGSTVWWVLGGTVVGVAIGVLAAERMSGRSLRGGGWLRKARRLVRLATGKWGPLVDVALDVRDAWAERRAAKARDDEPDDDSDEEYEEDDDFEVDVEVDLDEDADDDEIEEEEEEDDEKEEEEEEEEEDDHPIAARVLEAFLNDPVLAERAVEINADDRGNVFLHGRVRAAREVAHAVTIAGGVPGVTAVRQRLRVRDLR